MENGEEGTQNDKRGKDDENTGVEVRSWVVYKRSHQRTWLPCYLNEIERGTRRKKEVKRVDTYKWQKREEQRKSQSEES